MTDTLREAYRVMRTIRAFEERVHDEFATGEPGFYAGEEASAAGVCAHLDDRDTVAGAHRGHCIAKGVDVKAVMAAVYGRKTGSCHGKGGPPLVCGAALAAKQQNTGGVGVAFIGAGDQGDTLEALNLASAQDLPAIFVAADTIADRAAGFGMPGVIVDGFDFFAVHEAAGEAIGRARAGGGPTLLEVTFTRYAQENLDCLKSFRARVTEAGELAEQVLDDIDAAVAKLIEDAVSEAKATPMP
ncbi:thiamine pyrophosphate-dependent dehydrogenase E1 component subunit alpha [Amycolatopsis sp. NPDC098790]|uniref:thiamine pyrophosphate-dependent dehydrogenase E1 component subunit alpha n=1 Tax=Amycolatopsis sp. NPDC098790 TaxID=3363939 RepID=UPI003813068B